MSCPTGCVIVHLSQPDALVMSSVNRLDEIRRTVSDLGPAIAFQLVLVVVGSSFQHRLAYVSPFGDDSIARHVDINVLLLPEIERIHVLSPSSECPTTMHDVSEVNIKRLRSAVFSSADEMKVPSAILPMRLQLHRASSVLVPQHTNCLVKVPQLHRTIL